MIARVIFVALFVGSTACTKSSSDRSDLFEIERASGTILVRERANAPDRLRNATMRRGTFFVKRQCLGVLVDGIPFTPLLPKGSHFASGKQEFRIAGTAVRLNQVYSLPFANEVELAPEKIARAIGLPPECPARLMSLSKPSAA